MKSKRLFDAIRKNRKNDKKFDNAADEAEYYNRSLENGGLVSFITSIFCFGLSTYLMIYGVKQKIEAQTMTVGKDGGEMVVDIYFLAMLFFIAGIIMAIAPRVQAYFMARSEIRIKVKMRMEAEKDKK